MGTKTFTGMNNISFKNLTTFKTGGKIKYYFEVPTENDLIDNLWINTSNYQSASGAINFNVFIYYARTGRIYALKASGAVLKYDPSGSVAIVEDDTPSGLGTITNDAQGIVHSKDDILYIPYNNKIAKNDNGSWTADSLTLPTHLFVTSICEYGNYLAIACAPLSGVGKSIVYLWDRDATLTTLSDSIDWGDERLNVLNEVDGVLVGISYAPSNTTRFNSRVVFRYLSVSRAIKFKEFFTGSATGVVNQAKQLVNNRLYFPMLIYLNGANREGIWSVGRNKDGMLNVIQERTSNNDTALVSTKNIVGFIVVGDFMFISYLDNNTRAVSKTNDTASFTATSIYESKIFTGGDISLNKKLLGVTVMSEALPTAGQIVMKYKINAETSYTTILTEATDNSLSDSAINIESSGVNLPEFKEISFRIESTGNAVITGFSFKYEIYILWYRLVALCKFSISLLLFLRDH